MLNAQPEILLASVEQAPKLIEAQGEEVADGEESGKDADLVKLPEEDADAQLALEAEATGATGDVTRAEWVSALVSTFSMTVEEDNYPDNYYSDITAEDSFYRDVMVAVEFGVVDLEAGLPFRPNDAATRDFAAETLVYCLGFQATEEVSYSYNDTVPHPWAAQVAIDRGWFALVAGKFMPDQAITLAEKNGMLADAAEVLASDVIDVEHDNNAGFAAGVVVFPMGTKVEAPSEGTLMIYDRSIGLKNGDYFVVYYETLPLVFKALNVSAGEGCWVVSCTSEGTGDVIEEIDHEGILGTQMENFQPSAQSVYTTEDGIVVTEGETEFYVTPSATIPDSIPVKDLYVSKPITLSNGLTATISASLTGVVLHDRIATRNQNYEVYLSGDTHISTSVKGSLQEAIGSRKVELGKVPFLYGAGSLTLYFEYDLSGKIVLSWDGKMTAGFAYSGGSYRLIRSFQKTAFTITAEVTVQAGLGLSAGINILVIKAEVWASVGARGKATMAIYDSGTPTRCSDFQAWMYAKIGANASIKKITSWKWQEDIIKYSNSPVRVHYHFEDGAMVGECTRGKDFADKTGSPPGTYYTDPDSNYFSPWGTDGSSSYEEVIIWTYDLDKDSIATITGFQGGTASLVIPETLDGYKVRAIGNGVFRGKTRLRTVVISDGIESIGDSAFENCTNLRLIDFPDSVTSIGKYAFANTGLTQLTLPPKLRYIGTSILWNTAGVTELTIPKTVDSTGHEGRWVDTEPYGHIWSEVGPLSLSFITKLSFEEGMSTVPAHIAQKAPYLTDVTMPNSVTKIDAEAFENCVALKTIPLSAGLTEIGNSVFSECTAMTEINLPESLNTLGNYVFQHCGLTSLTLPKNLKYIGTGILWNTAGVTELTIPKTVDSTGHEGRWVDTEPYGHIWSEVGPLSLSFITKLSFEEGMSTVPAHIAQKAPYLTDVTMPNSVTKIDAEAFENCVALKTVPLSAGLTEIGSNVFSECTAMAEINLPESLNTLGNYVFQHCGLTSLTLPKNLRYIGTGILWNTAGVTELTIPKTVNSVGHEGRWVDTEPYGHIWSEVGPLSLSFITKLSFEEGMSTVPAHIAQKAPYLTDVTMPNSVTKIDAEALEYCIALETVKIPESVITIANSVFAKSGLKTVTVPQSVAEMGEYVFGGCTSLSKAEIQGPVKTLKNSFFEDCSMLEEVILPDTLEQINSWAFQRCTALKAIDLKAPIRVINQEAFRECKALTEVVVPDTVQYLESGVFRDCDGLTKAVISGDLYRMGTRIFYDCDALVNVQLGTGITTIPESTFEHCDVLESIALPYRVASIGANAFKNAVAFKSITIPRATESIGNGAFSYPANLTIYGVSGTYAETYANENNIKFVNREVNAARVTLTPDQMTLNKGKSATLRMNIEPSDFTDKVNLKSSNTSIVTVDDSGLVQAVGIGTAVIKVTAGSASASCKVTVLQPVTNITLNAYSREMQALETYQLTAKVYPENADNPSLRWKSDNENVASVDENGLVTAHAKGSAKITVTASDGSGVTNICRITVANNGYIAATVEELESPHPYPDSCKDFWQYTVDGATGLNVTFDAQTELEDGFDYLMVLDGSGNVLGKYTSIELAGQTVTVPGNTVRIQINSDNGGNEWGFKVSSVIAKETAATYTVEYNANGGNGAPADQTKTAGVALTLSLEKPTRDGYQFAGWATSSMASAAEYQPGDRYETDQNLKLYAVWNEQHTHKPGTATRENEVAATCTAEGHYDEVTRCSVCGEELSRETKTNAALGHSYVNGVCTRCGEKEISTMEFEDVSDPSAYYYEPVYWAASRGVTSGTSPTTFSPGKDCTRGQIVTFLWKAMGSPEPRSTDNPFTDVKPSDYFYKPVLWAKENGVTAGTSATTFSPGKGCTRGQIVTFLWKAMRSPGPRDTSNPFTDVKPSDYFYNPVLWAKESGVTSGTSATTFSPGKTCTRAQAMTFLYKATH